MTISALPPAPNKTTDSAATFNTKANTFVAALQTFATEANALEANVNAKETAAAASAVAAAESAVDAAESAATAETAALNAVLAPGSNATSSTTLAVGSGSKSLMVQTGKNFVAGMKVIVASSVTPTIYMYGTITTYNSGTGALVITVEDYSGSGSLSLWTISLSGPKQGALTLPSGVEMLGGTPGMQLDNVTILPRWLHITAGARMDSTNTYSMNLPSELFKDVLTAWVAGTSQGGNLHVDFATPGSLLNVYALRRDSDGAVDVGVLSQTLSIASYLPVGYSTYRWLGFVSIYSYTSSRLFSMAGDNVLFRQAFTVLTDVNTVALNSQSLAEYIPAGRTESVTIGVSGGTGLVASYWGSNAGEAETKLVAPAGATWVSILGQESIATIHPTSAGAIYANTGGEAIDVWLKSVKIIR